MPRFLLNPTFDIETGKLLSHDGEFFHDKTPLLFDREVAGQAKKAKTTADVTAGGYGSAATGEGTTVRGELTKEALHPQGFAPTDLNNMLVQQQEAAGGGNAAIGGEGRLSALRTRGTAGGIAPALAEAARAKGRTLATGALDVANRNAMLREQQRQQGLAGLQGLYGTDVSAQMKAMGLSAEDLQNELAAGRQGWVQNTEGILNSIKGAGGTLPSGASFAV